MNGEQRNIKTSSVVRTLGTLVERLGGYAANYIFKNHQTFDLTNIILQLPRLSSEFEGYRIVHISDFHLGTWLDKERLQTVIEIVNRLEPDLIAITGDFISQAAAQFADQLIFNLGKLEPRDAVVAVLGNHDHWTNPEMIRDVLKQTMVQDLSNTVLSLRRGEGILHIAGVDDCMEELDRLPLVLEQLNGADSAILLAHEPDYADTSAASGRFDLQLSGHSHGGQLVLPLIGIPYLPPHARKYPSGLYQVNGMYLYTNRGLGTTYLQLRYKCPPEIANITLLPGYCHRTSWPSCPSTS